MKIGERMLRKLIKEILLESGAPDVKYYIRGKDGKQAWGRKWKWVDADFAPYEAMTFKTPEAAQKFIDRMEHLVGWGYWGEQTIVDEMQ